MRSYEVTFIVDPVLSGDEIKSTAKIYSDLLTEDGCTIVNKDELGLKQLAYPINKRSTGIYFCTEFQSENGSILPNMELAMRRDERIMRFLTVRLDKYGVKYNDDKRNGLIGKKKSSKSEGETVVAEAPKKAAPKKAAPVKPAPEKAAPAPVVEAPVAVAPVVEAPEKAAPVKEEE